MIKKLLIANRGEIACRIMRTCRQMGITTVAVFSEADQHALHVEMADEAVYLGASQATASYLNLQAVLDAIERSGADAVHPGYGFLAENARFAYMMEAMDVTFIGPRGGAIEAMGDKAVAKAFLQNVPLIPGYHNYDQTDATLIAAAADIGYPIMVKAAAGGGGKGMRLVETAAALPDVLAATRREAQAAFGDDTLMLEKALIRPRHIEVQIIADQYGHVIALGERECSIQRRHQKIIEESPAFGLDPDVRRAMHQTAIQAARQLGYHNAGTVEFLLDRDDQFYFIEMNTRLQVEHPVTEAVYAIDLVRWQIEIARGTPLSDLLPPYAGVSDFDYMPDGHAIEVRVYAEDPDNHFLPATGQVLHWDVPEHVRVDTGIRTGDEITTFYDPMLAKIIAHGLSRQDAIQRLDYALSKTVLAGPKNNIRFLRRTLIHDDFLAGHIHIDFIADHPELFDVATLHPPIVLVAAAIAQHGPYTQHWRNNPNRPIKHTYQFGAAQHIIELTPQSDTNYLVTLGTSTLSVGLLAARESTYRFNIDGYIQQATVIINQDDVWVHTLEDIYQLRWVSPLPLPSTQSAIRGSLRAPMPGQIINVAVNVGDSVQEGDALLIMEAMKMEHTVVAPHDGVVEEIFYQVGDAAQADDILLALSALGDDEEPVS